MLDYPFDEINKVTKQLDKILDKPNIKFKDFDELKESSNEQDKKAWKKFSEIENKYKEIFELARKFEGIQRNMGVHASGVLVTPMPVMDMIPIRTHKDGTTICLFAGEQLEELNLVKFDILGLKTVSLIRMTLEQINKDLTIEDLFANIDLNDPNLFEMINNMQTDGLFQIESNLFKQLIKEIKPDNFNDIVALTSIARPGPLNAGMNKAYARRKHGDEEAIEPLDDTWDIVKNSYGTIIYQEQIMQIAKKVAKVDDNQADSYYRKVLAKKKIKMLPLCKQWFIYGKINEEPPKNYDENNRKQPMYDPEGKYGRAILGGISNGYNKQELIDFWTQMEGYASYLFNLSHAVCYTVITIACAYLKKYYPKQYMANLLTITDDEDKKEQYIIAADKMGLEVLHPDINNSEMNFSVKNGKIVYGLSSIKGVGESKVEEIIKNRPYKNLGDIFNKLPRKILDKRVGVALIKSGCFDFEDKNRVAMLNKFFKLRNDKKELEELIQDENRYNKEICMQFEKETLSTEITHKTWWRSIKPNTKISSTFEIISVSEIYDRKKRLMAFVNGISNNCKVEMVVFAKQYSKLHEFFDTSRCREVVVTGKKDDNNKLLVSNAKLPTVNLNKDNISRLASVI